MESGLQGEYLRVLIPSLASKNYPGKDCIASHMTEEGAPLGAVSMRISLNHANEAANRFRDESVLFAIIISLPLLGFVYYCRHGAKERYRHWAYGRGNARNGTACRAVAGIGIALHSLRGAARSTPGGDFPARRAIVWCLAFSRA